MKFNASQLDKDFYITRAKAEANEIFSNENTRRGRSFQNILETTLYGHAAEVYLIQECGFKDDDRKYKDLFDTDGSSVEIKVTEGDYYVPYVLERAEKAKMQTWRGSPDILYVFIGNKKSADYKLNGIYKWNKKRFVLQRNKNMV